MKKLIVLLITVLILAPTYIQSTQKAKKIIPNPLRSEAIIKNNDIDHYKYVFEMDRDIVDPREYRELKIALQDASPKDTILINISCSGGSVDIGTSIIQELLDTQAHTIAKINYAYSMAALVALACKEIRANQDSMLMVHFYSIRLPEGPINAAVLRKQMNIYGSQFESIINTLCKGFLTPTEIAIICSGGEVYVNGYDIVTRFKKKH